MHSRTALVSVLALMLGAIGTPVSATTFEEDQKLCNSSDTKPDDGIAACTRQIESGRWEGHDLAISYYNRGIFWYDKDDNDKAIADYTKAIELSPDYASAFNNRGNAYAAKGDLDRAIADYDRAIADRRQGPVPLEQPRARLEAQGRLRPRHRRLRSGDQDRSRLHGRLHQSRPDL